KQHLAAPLVRGEFAWPRLLFRFGDARADVANLESVPFQRIDATERLALGWPLLRDQVDGLWRRCPVERVLENEHDLIRALLGPVLVPDPDSAPVPVEPPERRRSHLGAVNFRRNTFPVTADPVQVTEDEQDISAVLPGGQFAGAWLLLRLGGVGADVANLQRVLIQ